MDLSMQSSCHNYVLGSRSAMNLALNTSVKDLRSGRQTARPEEEYQSRMMQHDGGLIVEETKQEISYD